MPFRVSAAALLLMVALFGGAPAPTLATLAQTDPDEGLVDDTSYESPAFGYTLEWDEEAWTPSSATSEDRGDQLELEHDLGLLYIDSYAAPGADVTDCIEAEVETATEEDGVTDVAIAENADGDPIEDATRTYAFGVYTFVFAGDDGASERAVYIECRSIEDGDAILQFTAINFDRTGFDDFIADTLEVTETLQLDGERRPAGNNVSAADLSIAELGDTTSGTDSYSDESFGFNVTWDPEVWEQVESDAEDYLRIETETTSLYFEGLAYTGTVDDAFAELTDAGTIEDGSSVTDWKPGEDRDGEPLTGASGDGVYGVFTYLFTDPETDDTEDRIVYIQVQPLVEGESVVAMTAITYDQAAYNDEIGLVFDVIETLEITGEEPRETEEPDPEIDDDIWIYRPAPIAS